MSAQKVVSHLFMASQSDIRLFLNLLADLIRHLDHQNRQGEWNVFPAPAALSTSSSPVPDHSSYLQERSPQAQNGHAPPSLPPNSADQYTNLVDDGSLSHVHRNDQDSISFDSWFEDSSTSGAAMGNEGGSIPVEMADPSFPRQLALIGQLSEQGHGPQSFEVSGPPLSQPSREDLFPCGDAKYGRTLMVQSGTSSEVQVNAGQKKVWCTWPRCSAVVRKDCLTRHLNEIHRGIVKHVCTHCQKPFKRLYLKTKHEVICCQEI